MQPQNNNNKALIVAIAIIAGGAFLPQIKTFVSKVVEKQDAKPVVVVPDGSVPAFTPSNELRTSLSPVVAAASSEVDKSSLPLRAQFYSDLAAAVELSGDKIGTTEQFVAINQMAGQWTFTGKSPTPALNTAATEFMKSYVIANQAGLPSERRAKLIEALRGISWAIQQANKPPVA